MGYISATRTRRAVPFGPISTTFGEVVGAVNLIIQSDFRLDDQQSQWENGKPL